MSRKYKFHDPDELYFVSFATVNWVDVFTRDVYRAVILDSLNYCIANKGLELYAWCIMSNHVHLIIGSNHKPMQDIIRDLKSFTSRTLKEEITNNPQESRKDWMLQMFTRAGKRNGNNHDWQFWQQNNQPIELWNADIAEEKLDYIHQNPVVAGWVSAPEDYVWSSARDYCGEKGLIEVVHLF